MDDYAVLLCCCTVALLSCFLAACCAWSFVLVILSSCCMLLSTNAEIACTSDKYPLTSTCTILQPALTSGPCPCMCGYQSLIWWARLQASGLRRDRGHNHWRSGSKTRITPKQDIRFIAWAQRAPGDGNIVLRRNGRLIDAHALNSTSHCLATRLTTGIQPRLRLRSGA